MIPTRNDQTILTDEEFLILEKAREIIKKYATQSKHFFDGADSCIEFCMYNLAHLDRENFMVMFLRNDYSLISADIMFSGNLDSFHLEPVEVVRRALLLKSPKIVLSHNHPSGYNQPSMADIKLTKRIIELCDEFEIKVLDHIVVGHEPLSMFSEGFM